MRRKKGGGGRREGKGDRRQIGWTKFLFSLGSPGDFVLAFIKFKYVTMKQYICATMDCMDCMGFQGMLIYVQSTTG